MLDLQRRCGAAAGREATAALGEMIEELRRTARRTISHHQPCCPSIGDDEATLLVLLAACQRGDSLLAQTAAQALSGALHADALAARIRTWAEEEGATIGSAAAEGLRVVVIDDDEDEGPGPAGDVVLVAGGTND